MEEEYPNVWIFQLNTTKLEIIFITETTTAKETQPPTPPETTGKYNTQM